MDCSPSLSPAWSKSWLNTQFYTFFRQLDRGISFCCRFLLLNITTFRWFATAECFDVCYTEVPRGTVQYSDKHLLPYVRFSRHDNRQQGSVSARSVQAEPNSIMIGIRILAEWHQQSWVLFWNSGALQSIVECCSCSMGPGLLRAPDSSYNSCITL